MGGEHLNGYVSVCVYWKQIHSSVQFNLSLFFYANGDVLASKGKRATVMIVIIGPVFPVLPALALRSPCDDLLLVAAMKNVSRTSFRSVAYSVWHYKNRGTPPAHRALVSYPWGWLAHIPTQRYTRKGCQGFHVHLALCLVDRTRAHGLDSDRNWD